jgi:hypothetical protein
VLFKHSSPSRERRAALAMEEYISRLEQWEWYAGTHDLETLRRHGCGNSVSCLAVHSSPKLPPAKSNRSFYTAAAGGYALCHLQCSNLCRSFKFAKTIFLAVCISSIMPSSQDWWAQLFQDYVAKFHQIKPRVGSK